ncbi:phosphoglycerate mutase-like protein 4 [Sesamum indicum]|uniref:Phosphoglycerate mutase-like protein 4 n=1 Tax=Sesamum indicum TaxID=4182 RepID=A0A6I9UDH4_SESIN|nr:phosphoglycerate mutase-like protein 4 [Sesamum indicum]
MSSVGLTSVKSPPQRHSSPSPPLPINRRHFNSLLFKSQKIFQPVCLSLILLDFMADSDTRASVLPQSECDENGGTIETVGRNYAEIIVIRHGETEWNADRRIQGHLDVNLNDVGRQQAAAVADRLSREPKISAVYSSDLKRAFDTAKIIAKSCGVLEVIKDPDLRERHLGDLQGIIFHEAAKVNPEAHKAFVSNQKDQEIPGGGESFSQLYERCTSALQRIANKHRGERVVVVSHGGTIRALHKKASPHRGPSARVLNTSVNVFHVSDNEWSIKSWGDVSHLDQTGFLESGFGGDKHSG